MNFVKHFELEGRHAFLGASKFHWLNYDEDKLIKSYQNNKAKEIGTRIHEFAAEAIELGIKLPKSKKTLNMFVNDAIGFKMTPEVVLYYSDNCFGTADAISCRRERGSEKMKLRIHDLKTGAVKAHMEQLLIYAALFCLEYKVKPVEIDIELRIYQSDEVLIHEPGPDEIISIIDKIISSDKTINKLKYEEVLP